MEKNNLSLVSLIVSLVTLVLVAYSSFFGTSTEVMKWLESLEALKVWGIENYNLVKKIYSSDQFKKTQADSLQQAVAQFEGGAADTGAEAPATAPADQQAGADGFTRGTLTTEQITSVLEGVAYEGKADAKIVLVEYSDVECPFCQRHFSSKTVESILAKYPDLVKTTYKHFPLSFHATAQKAAEAIECAAAQDKSVEFKNALFAASIAAADKKPTSEVILAVAKELGLAEADFSKCLDSDATADKVKSNMNEGSTLFGVTGTPGNVVLNTETGKYVVVSGAYPADAFDTVVTELQ